jgi:hypothetical protein
MASFKRSRALGALAIALAAGCAATTNGVDPDEMTAASHREESSRTRLQAEAQARKYDESRDQEWSATGGPQCRDVSFPSRVYNPTRKYRAQADALRRHADQHLAAAAELERFTQAECAQFSPEIRKQCPLIGNVVGVEEIESGVSLELRQGMPLDAVVAHMRCHHAFGREHGAGVHDCPLYIAGIQVELGSDGKSVTITSRDPRSVDTIRKRARRYVGLDGACPNPDR